MNKKLGKILAAIIQSKPTNFQRTYTAVRGVLDPPEPAPSMLNMCPPSFWLCIIRMASRVQRMDPTRFVETIFSQNHMTVARDQLKNKVCKNKCNKSLNW